MTTTQTTYDIPVRLDFDDHADDFARAMVRLDHAATKQLDQVGFDHRLRELVRVRASQLNGCAYCIDMHSKDARAVGETEQRLYALPVWRETPYFTARERAALALTEAVTRLGVAPVSDEVFATAAVEFSDHEVAALIALIVTINAWNAIGATTHTWAPGSYQP